MLLLDTQAAIWWLTDDPKLSEAASQAISASEETLAISAASVWEIEIKRASGKYTGLSLLEAAGKAGFAVLEITGSHGVAAAQLPLHHNDPFDRMIIAQAQVEGLTVVSSDSRFPAYLPNTIW